ncbi:MAG: hypothetical protein OXJ64_15230, partial [Boseongicola sp.]|nr:hypothetical protein [Boseongicola sp.]
TMEQVVVSILVEPGFLPPVLAFERNAQRIANQNGQTVRYHVRVCATADVDLVERLDGKHEGALGQAGMRTLDWRLMVTLPQ